MEEVKTTIDGIPVTVEKGATILAAAQKAGIYIPTFATIPACPRMARAASAW